MRRRLSGTAAVLLFAIGLCLAACFAGCATFGRATAPRVGQEQAVDIVWHEVYGRTDRPPLIRWKEGGELSCTDSQSGKPGFPVLDIDPGNPDGEVVGHCREGFTWSPLEVLVAWHGELSFSETALAHELLHVALLRRGIFLGHHRRPDFQPAIDRANAALIEAGR